MHKKPFALGEPALGDAFIGRKKLAEQLCAMIFNNDSSRRVSIMGLPRIGKTSLVKNALNAGKVKEHGYLFVDISLEGIISSVDFWQLIVRKLERALARQGIRNTEFSELAESVYNCKTYGALLCASVKDIFELVTEMNKTVLLVIDEFDGARKLFAGESANFGLIRSVTSQYGFLIKTVLISRRSIKSIVSAAESNLPADSTLYGVFSDRIAVKGFDDDDMSEYYDIFANPPDKETLRYYCGRHPFLLSLFGNAILNDGAKPIEEIFADLREVIIEYYDSIVSLFREDETLQKFFECVIGPRVTVTKYDVLGLASIGAIEPAGNRYMAIAECFLEYARTLNITFKSWETLETTQKALQSIVKTDYPDGYKSNPTEYAKMQRYVKKNLRNFGYTSDVADVAPLRYTVQIIVSNWPKFKKYFNNDSVGDWKPKLEFCAKIRDPLGHALSDFLSDENKNLLGIYCGQITESITKMHKL